MDPTSIPVDSWLRQRLRQESEARKQVQPLSREQVVEKLRYAVKAAGWSDAGQVAVTLMELAEVDQIHGLHLDGKEALAAAERWSGRWHEPFLPGGETPSAHIQARLAALLAKVEADRFADRSPRAIIGEAVDRFGLEAVMAGAEVDTTEHDRLRRLHAGIELPPATKTMRTLCAAARRLLEAELGPASAA